jgi:hypothetical protein
MVLVAFISFSLFFISIYYYYYCYHHQQHQHQKLEAAQMRFLRPLLGLTRDWTARETLTSVTD